MTLGTKIRFNNRPLLVCNSLFLWLLFGSATALFSFELTSTRHLSWDDLVIGQTMKFVPQAGQRFDVDLDSVSLNQLPPELRKDPALARLAIGHFLQNPKIIDGGVFGKVGETNVYLSLRDRIPDYNRLYWVMVNVLSTHYGCLMRQRIVQGDHLEAACKDGRRVVFRRSMGQSLIRFFAKQFDRQGNELIVRGGKIIDPDASVQINF
jgi:hypothetical protein